MSGAVWTTMVGHAVNGEWRRNPEGFERFTLAALFLGLMRIVGGRGVAIIGPDVAARHGLPTGELPTESDDFRNHGCAVELRTQGFKLKQIGRWFHVEHPRVQGPGVWFGLAEFIGADYNPMFAGSSRTDITAALAEWERITGYVWRKGGGDSGNAILKRMTYGRRHTKPEFWANRPDEQPAAGELAYDRRSWMCAKDLRPDTAYGHDKVRAYLGAMTTVKVAGAKLTHDGLTAYSKARAGWYAVELGPWEFSRVMPHPAGYHSVPVDPDRPDGPVWLAHPTVALLDELARDGFITFDIVDSWTAPATDLLINYGRTLREHWEATATIEDPAVRSLVRKSMKAVYRQAHGYWRSGQSEIQRRDWAGALVAGARSNTFRAVWKLWRGPAEKFDGPFPVFIDTDDVYYPEPLTPEGWTVWDDRPDLDDVTKLGHWRRSKVLGRGADVSRETKAA
jgi:hypothetical protein